MDYLQSGAALRDRWWQFGLGWGITNSRHDAGDKLRGKKKVKIDLNDPKAWTLKSAADLIGSASDEHDHVQLRVTDKGIFYISQGVVGNAQTQNLRFRLETWSQGNGHVGPDAAQDEKWVGRIYQVVKDNWPAPTFPYIDIY